MVDVMSFVIVFYVFGYVVKKNVDKYFGFVDEVVDFEIGVICWILIVFEFYMMSVKFGFGWYFVEK